VGAKAGQNKKSAGRQRLALILFGVLFVVLFAVIAVAQGLTKPSVPEGDVVLVENVPSDVGQISEAEFRRALVQQAAGEGVKKIPKEGSKKFEELRDATLGELINAAWVQGAAEEFDLSATKKKVDEELEKIKEQNFPTAAAYEEFLKTSKLTQADVDDRVRLQVLSNEITEKLQGDVGVPSESEIAAYYEAAKATQFTTKPSRDIRLVVNKDKAEIEAAKTALDEDDSPANWKKVAQKYSSDPTTKTKGGLQPGLSEELLATAGPLKDAIFGAATNEIVGPIKYQGNYTVIEVVKLNPEKVQTLEEAKGQISSTLTQQRQEDALNQFVSGWQSKWGSRTFCASGFVIKTCSNYKGDGRPIGANPACYEADPKTPATECPAPVTANQPTLPGKVTILQPKGEPFPQRPVPVAAAKAGAEGEVLPEGAAPTGE
jgi:foldase protein PrsA